MTVLESTLSVENRYRQLFRQRLVILAVIFIAIISSLLLDFTLGPSGRFSFCAPVRPAAR